MTTFVWTVELQDYTILSLNVLIAERESKGDPQQEGIFIHLLNSQLGTRSIKETM